MNKEKNGQELLPNRFVRVKGLEPPRLSSLDPKSSAATNYATRALLDCECKVNTFFIFHQISEGFFFILEIKKCICTAPGNNPETKKG